MDGIDKEVADRRLKLGASGLPPGAEKKWGLALSGGGIRSATFCFGLLRALAHRKLLLRFDLMSTVSGGGYIGCAVGSLFNRAKSRTDTLQVEEAIDGRYPTLGEDKQPGAEKPTTWFLWWLRANGRYLIPRGARDTAFAFALYLRNLAGIHFELGLIAIVLGLVLCGVDLLVWFALERLGYRFATNEFFELLRGLPDWLPAISVALPFVALSAARLGAAYWAVPWVQARMAPSGPAAVAPQGPPAPAAPASSPAASPVSGVSPASPLSTPGSAANTATSNSASSGRRSTSARFWVVCGLALVGDVALSRLFYLYGITDGVVGGVLRNVVWWTCSALIALWVLGALTARRQLLKDGAAVSAALQADAARNKLTKRFSRRLRLVVLIVLAGLVDRVAWAFAFYELSVVNAGLTLALAAAVVRALLPLVSSLSATKTAGSGALLFFGRIAGYLLTFLLTSWWVTLVYMAVLGSLFSGQQLNYADSSRVLALLAVPVVGYMLWTGRNLAFLNLSSLHSFYRARLVRSYMGAANAKRFIKDDPPPPLGALTAVTSVMPVEGSRASIDDVWADDDASLTSYRPQDFGGPVHLMTVCVNQTRDPRGKIFNQDRRGLPLTVASGGLMRLSQDPWKQLDKGPGMSVGRWMAISGAAVAPGMGALTRGGTAALMTFAGVRLGYWWSSAERGDPGDEKSPLLAKSKGLLNELFGVFEGTAAPDWFLSDGGHFENTGAYALLGERAEVIVLADCGADPKYAFENLENLVRIARVDLQAEIQFQRPISPQGAKEPGTAKLRDKYRLLQPTSTDLPPELAFFGSINDLASPESIACLAMAKVVYGGANEGRGILILIKPNICSGLPVDLLNFKAQYPDFPQQPTSDQFFSEAQWESYFLLGQFLGGKLNRGFIDRVLANPAEFFVDDECSPFDAPKRDGSAVKQAVAAVGRLPARIGTTAVGTTIGLGAVATIGVSTWQAIDSVKTAYSKKTSDERAALKELTELWAKIPAPSYSQGHDKDSSLAISNVAAAIVRTADSLCPGGEASWYLRSPVAAQITNDTINRCKDLLVSERGSACSMLLEAANPDLKSPLPTCLSWKSERERAVPPPLYWGYDYSATLTIDYWHPCDPLRWALLAAEREHIQTFGVLLGRQSQPAYGNSLPSERIPDECHVSPLIRASAAAQPEVATEQPSSASPAPVRPTVPSTAPPAPAPAGAVSGARATRPDAYVPFAVPAPLGPNAMLVPAFPSLKPPSLGNPSLTQEVVPPTAAPSASAASPTAGASAPTVAPPAAAPTPPVAPPVAAVQSQTATPPSGTGVSTCQAGPIPQAFADKAGVCQDVKIYVQTFGPAQKPEFSCYQSKWDSWLGAKRLNIEDVVASARAKDRPDPAPVRSTVIRYHDSDSIPCASALGPVLGKTWRVEPLSPKYTSSRMTVEVWAAPDTETPSR